MSYSLCRWLKLSLAQYCWALLLLNLFLLGCMDPTQQVHPFVEAFKKEYPQNIQKVELEDHKHVQVVWTGNPSLQPLIFVHGSPGSWEGWAEFLMNSDLQKRFHVIAFDRWGYGGSRKGVAEKSLRSQATAILAALQLNQSQLPAILVGHSYGGPVIAQFAADFSEKVQGLVFVASSVDPYLEEVKWIQYPAQWLLIKSLLPVSLTVCNEEILALKQELLAIDWSRIHAKVSIVHGEDDNLVPIGNVDFLQQKLSPQIVFLIKQSQLNHFIPWKRPDLILNAIKAL